MLRPKEPDVVIDDVATERLTRPLAFLEAIGGLEQACGYEGGVGRRVHVAFESVRGLDLVGDPVEARREGGRKREVGKFI